MKAMRHVYVIGAPSGPFKIGIASNLRERLSGIQTGSPVKMSVIHFESMPHSDARLVERHAHKLLHAYRMTGEWFNVSLENAKAAVTYAASVVAETAHERARAERARKERQQREEAERAAALEAAKKRALEAITVRVPGVDLVHRVTEQEFFAENERIKRERDAPRRAAAKAFSQRMAEAKRRKAARLPSD